MRYLFFILIIVVVFLFWRASLRKRTPPDAETSQTEAGEMVQCRTCGVYLPREDAVVDGHFFFCSAEHRDSDRK